MLKQIYVIIYDGLKFIFSHAPKKIEQTQQKSNPTKLDQQHGPHSIGLS